MAAIMAAQVIGSPASSRPLAAASRALSLAGTLALLARARRFADMAGLPGCAAASVVAAVSAGVGVVVGDGALALATCFLCARGAAAVDVGWGLVFFLAMVVLRG